MPTPAQSAPSAYAPFSSETSEHGRLPLAPIDRPDHLFPRLLFGFARRQFGMVPTAFRVIYARSPFLALVSLVLYAYLGRYLSLEPSLRYLVQIASAQQNGCTFCADLLLAGAIREKLGRERFAALDAFETSDRFTQREKAALAYARAVHASLHVPDAIWQALAAHFSERERVDLVWLCALERYFNSMAVPLRVGSDRLAER
jgi:AhpD family alkylhydroperoxidase